MSDKDDLLSFINNMLELKKQPRGDYKEFLERVWGERMDERTLLATKIGQITNEETEIRKPTLPVINEKSELSDFVGERSDLLYKLLEIPVTFLQNPDWHLQSEYDAVKKSIRNVCPLNDSCERALGLATRLNTKLTRKEDGFKELIQVVEAHCKQFSVKSKKDLECFY